MVLRHVDAPRSQFESPLEVFKSSLLQEQKVTEAIRRLYDVAMDQRDHESRNLLGWFLDEQVEEEKTVQDMIDRLELVEGHPVGMLQLDQEAASRNLVTDEA